MWPHSELNQIGYKKKNINYKDFCNITSRLDFIQVRFGLFFLTLSLLYFTLAIPWIEELSRYFHKKIMWSDNESSRDSVVDLTDSPPLKTKKRKRETFTSKPVPKVSVFKKRNLFLHNLILWYKVYGCVVQVTLHVWSIFSLPLA